MKADRIRTTGQRPFFSYRRGRTAASDHAPQYGRSMEGSEGSNGDDLQEIHDDSRQEHSGQDPQDEQGHDPARDPTGRKPRTWQQVNPRVEYVDFLQMTPARSRAMPRPRITPPPAPSDHAERRTDPTGRKQARALHDAGSNHSNGPPCKSGARICLYSDF